MESKEPAAKRLAAEIDGAKLEGEGTFILAVTHLRPVRPRAGWYHLTVALTDAKREPSLTPKPSRTPLMTGLVSGGGRLVMPWFEGRLFPMVEMADGTTIDARAHRLEAAFVDLLGTLVPPGGHLMIEYESPGQHETHAELLLRVPPVASYLGSLMFHAGFRGDFKDCTSRRAVTRVRASSRRTNHRRQRLRAPRCGTNCAILQPSSNDRSPIGPKTPP